jgi:hypothetical protein
MTKTVATSEGERNVKMGKLGNLGKRKNIESREGAKAQRKEKNKKIESRRGAGGAEKNKLKTDYILCETRSSRRPRREKGY